MNVAGLLILTEKLKFILAGYLVIECVEVIMVTGKCEGEHIYVCEGCILFPEAGDPNDKFTCDGCVITSEIGKTGCNECKESPGVS